MQKTEATLFGSLFTFTDIDDKGVVIVAVPPGTKSVPVRFLLHNPGVTMNNVRCKAL